VSKSVIAQFITRHRIKRPIVFPRNRRHPPIFALPLDLSPDNFRPTSHRFPPAMPSIPKKVVERLTAGLKQFQPILSTAKARDDGEADTVMIVTDMLASVFGYDKYSEVTAEYAIRGTAGRQNRNRANQGCPRDGGAQGRGDRW
jgi:hypothetical protein